MRSVVHRCVVILSLLLAPLALHGRVASEHIALIPVKTGPPPEGCLAPLVRASFYSTNFEGKIMANGGTFHEAVPTAASRTYPLGAVLEVTAQSTGKTVRLRVTDAGPWNNKFCLDLSTAAFKGLGLDEKRGWDWVRITRIK